MDADGNYFTLKPNGDIQFLERKSADAKHKSERDFEYLKIKHHDFGESGKVSIQGLNSAGDIVIKNAKNEKVVLGRNGDKVVVKP